MNRNLPILFVDDDEDDVFHLTRTLRRLNVTSKINVVDTGLEAIRYLEGQGQYSDRVQHPFPSVVILDMRMPQGGGFETLKWLRSHPEFSIIPIIVLSGSGFGEEVKTAYQLGANCYLRKPGSPSELEAMMKLTIQFWAICEKPEYHHDGTGQAAGSSA